jgi:hypothetical protein
VCEFFRYSNFFISIIFFPTEMRGKKREKKKLFICSILFCAFFSTFFKNEVESFTLCYLARLKSDFECVMINAMFETVQKCLSVLEHCWVNVTF